MRKPVVRRGFLFPLALLAVTAAAAAESSAGPRLLGTFYRPDAADPEFGPYWGSASQEEGAESSLGASVHVYLHNTGPEPVTVEDVLFEGISLSKAVAHSEKKRKHILHPASIFFSDIPAEQRDRLIKAGEPIWWRVEPGSIAAGAAAEVTVRLRSIPQVDSVRLAVATGPDSIEANVPVRPGQPAFAGISFSPGLDRVYAYLPAGKTESQKPVRLRMDGRDLTDGVTIETDPAYELAPAVAALREPLEPLSFHVFEALYADGRRAYAGMRAWSDEFAYGMWGAMPGKESDAPLARRYVMDLHRHMVNVQMEMVGSAAVREFLKSDAGRALSETLGVRRMVDDVGKGRTRDPFAYFLVDEPDCGDYRVEDLPDSKRIGSLAQPLVQRSAELREQDPSTPQLLNVDMTYKPNNWFIYGQLPDIFAADPYYQERLREAVWSHPERLPLYRKATFVYAVGSTCRAACSPKPLHLILNSVRHTKPDRRFRYATPEEKRIEVFYALAAGAKGLSYWWYTPAGTYYGVGADDPEARRLWTEIGRLGAEVRTAGPVLVRSCPAAVPVTAPSRLWVRSLLAGRDTVVVLCVNDDYENTGTGTTIRPVENARLALTLPKWLEAKDVFEVSAGGIGDVAWSATGPQLDLDLGPVQVSRLLIATEDSGLRTALEGRYRAEFAARAAELPGRP